MNILLRLPNWLGDIVMSTALVKALSLRYPGCTIDVIVKDGLQELVPLLPGVSDYHVFSKKKYGGIIGAIKFGRFCAARKKYDLYISLSDSFSSAVIGFFSGSRVRVGYSKEFRSFLLTHPLKKPEGLHRVEEYLHLQHYDNNAASIDGAVAITTKDIPADPVAAELQKRSGIKIMINIHSAAESRKIPSEKAIALGKKLIAHFDCTLVFTGAVTEKERTQSVIAGIGEPGRCLDFSGKMGLASLARLGTLVDLAISTDSGVAHLVNAVGTPGIVLFGAGNDKNTAPYNKRHCMVVRAEGIECAPCVSNTCRFNHFGCMHRISEDSIISMVNPFVVKREYTKI